MASAAASATVGPPGTLPGNARTTATTATAAAAARPATKPRERPSARTLRAGRRAASPERSRSGALTDSAASRVTPMARRCSSRRARSTGDRSSSASSAGRRLAGSEPSASAASSSSRIAGRSSAARLPVTADLDDVPCDHVPPRTPTRPEVFPRGRASPSSSAAAQPVAMQRPHPVGDRANRGIDGATVRPAGREGERLAARRSVADCSCSPCENECGSGTAELRTRDRPYARRDRSEERPRSTGEEVPPWLERAGGIRVAPRRTPAYVSGCSSRCRHGQRARCSSKAVAVSGRQDCEVRSTTRPPR